MIKQKVELSTSLNPQYFEIRLNLLGIKFKEMPRSKNNNYIYIVECYPHNLVEVGIAISDTKHYSDYGFQSDILSVEDFNNNLDILLNGRNSLGLYMRDKQDYETYFVCDFNPKQIDLDTTLNLFNKLSEKMLIEQYEHKHTFMCVKGSMFIFLAIK